METPEYSHISSLQRHTEARYKEEDNGKQSLDRNSRLYTKCVNNYRK
jgi:hypothetical protein